MKKVTDEFGREVVIDDENKKLYTYNNAKKEITYNVEIIEEGKRTGFFTNYTETGIVDDIEQRLRKWNNAVLLAYSSDVGFNATKNDPDKKIWKDYVKRATENQDKIFDKNGDFLETLLINMRRK